ncbi:MAG: hypothetical protein U0892_09190 [Pirellulales bacterium]
MKKSTVRFAIVGAVLVLGALVIALAQHDARERVRETPPPTNQLAAEPEVIETPELVPTWSPVNRSESSPLVRANDDGNTTAGAVEASGRKSFLAGAAAQRGGNESVATAAYARPDSTSANNESVPGNPLRRGGETGLNSGVASLPDLTIPTEDFGNAVEVEGTSLPNSSLVMPANAELPQLGSQPATPAATTPALLPAEASGQATPNLPTTNMPSSGTAPSGLSAPNLPVLSFPGSTSSGIGLPAPSLPSLNNSGSNTNSTPAPLSSQSLPTLPVGNSTSSSASSRPTAGPVLNGASFNNASNNAASNSSQSPPVQSLPPAGVSIGNPTPLGSNGSNGPVPNTSPSNAGAAAAGAQSNSLAPKTNGWLDAAPVVPPASQQQLNQNFPPTAAVNDPKRPSVSNDVPRAAAGPRALPTSTRPALTDSTLVAGLVSKQPGNRYLDGSQNPIMLIQKRAPEEIQVGKRATFVITVRNAGNTTAHDVTVTDSVPDKTSFAESMPETQPTGDGLLVWKLGEMGPGDERTINVQIVPEAQGEIGSVATVHFAAQASVRTIATSPKLEITYTALPDVLIGDSYNIEVNVKNVGTGVAKGVRLEADLPSQLKHESGDAHLEAVFGALAPNESKRIRLDTRAVEPGAGECMIRGMSEDGLQQEQKVALQVLAPKLAMQISGPARRFVDRQAKFEIAIQNAGSAAATNCNIMVRLPSGLNFNGANNKGEYIPQEHAVYWSLPELPAGQTGTVELLVLPVQAGVQSIAAQTTADLSSQADARAELAVDEQGELAFSIQDDNDPIELSSSTTYTVEIRNIGMRPDGDVRLAVQLPAGSEVLKVDGGVHYAVRGGQLVFDAVPQMEARSTQTVRFEIRHAQPGIQIVRAQLTSRNRPSPVLKEESTEVYDDRK